ncbi:DUF3500 domain-containing protein [Massilia sp. 9I]|uniref:DUF3500 domain-containing protein n=1 Tax=Massilia sp. 9I TaxID=2653152 RepID=UPI0012F25C69|nr:DUF3500 domain-containing protein [Massilia sp. 9I]VXC57843.1 Immunoglobulin I-set domain-containing protein [Massilia sp. 9I]
MKYPRALALCVALAMLGGCGSSSDDSSSSSSGGTTTVVAAPAIATQPAAVSVAAGAAASFTVSATGGGTLSYQWRKGGTAISGATSATYSIAATTAADAGSYDVVVTNSAGSVTSAAAALTVASATAAPAIVTQPVSQSVATGAGVTLTVTASGSGTLSYQWRKGGVAIAGATSSSYTIASAAAADAGTYDVVVTNSIGSVTSSATTLAVTASTSSTQSVAAYNAAMSFYTSLTGTQQTSVQVAYSIDAARRWSNLPAAMSSRNGIKWGSLSTAQKTAATTLIKTALSDAGSSLQFGMQAADDYLNSIGGGSSYGNGEYYIAFVGTPTSTGFWILQLTGHHLTWNIAFNGSYKSPTPVFLGIEPKGSFTINGVTYDPMAAQRTAMASLGAALTAYSGAKLSGTYADILFGANGSGGGDGTCPRSYSSVTTHGLPYSSLSAADQALAQAAIRAYVNTQATEYANDLLGAYLSSTALAQTYVAYAGSGTVTTNGDYIRIEGPRLWIEFSTQRGVIVQNDIHYHTIWRDKFGDYGGKCVN